MNRTARAVRIGAIWMGATLLTLGVGGSCASAPRARPPIILVLVDTLRADHVGLYGYERATTPRIDALAESAAVFENAFSTAAWTLPAVASIMTGHWPSVHGAGMGDADNLFLRADPSLPSLAELLAAAGYRTGAVVNAGYLHPEFGLQRGFELYDFQPGSDREIRRADATTDRALDWVAGHRDEPFFLLLHLFDVHRHYDAPAPFRGRFTGAYRDRYGDTLDSLESRLQAERDSDLEFHIAAYDEEILFVDAQVGRLADGLRDLGVWDDAFVLLTADHGEAFFEHGVLAHGTGLHNEILRVPLIVWGPDIPAGNHRSAVSTVDIFPTVTGFAGLDEATRGAGLSLRGLLDGGPPPQRLLFAENTIYGTDLSAVVSWPLKLIRDFRNNEWELYDLMADPGETVDLLVGADRLTLRVARQLRDRALALRDGSAGQAVELDERMIRDLRALGYVQ